MKEKNYVIVKENVYITLKAIIARNGAADLPPSMTAGAAVQPPSATH